MDHLGWVTYPLATAVAGLLVLAFRWLVSLSRSVNALAERVAHLEGWRSGSLSASAPHGDAEHERGDADHEVNP